MIRRINTLENKYIKEVVDHIKDLLKESERVSENAAPGYDEGWYGGEINAYTNILDYLENQESKFDFEEENEELG